AKLGRDIGFPNANINVAENYKLIPAAGIYALTANIDDSSFKELKGMLYIGKRPVVKGTEKRIEVNFFDFNEQIYGKRIEIFFKDRIRGDEHFESLDKLKEKMKEDKKRATKILS